jgi:hypothetical protein
VGQAALVEESDFFSLLAGVESAFFSDEPDFSPDFSLDESDFESDEDADEEIAEESALRLSLR